MTNLRASRVAVTWFLAPRLLATSIDQLVTLLFAKYAREVAKALPSDEAHPPRLGKRKARTSNGLALG